MSETKLEAILSPIVRRYGIDRVEKCLRQMESSDRQRIRSKRSGRDKPVSGKGTTTTSRAKKSRVDAIEYANRMEVSSEKRSVITDIARKFENKSFLPTYRDVINFCEMYGIDVPASKSRANAVPRVFRFIAGMEADDIRGILDRGMFSGPSKLGPISDAIRHYRRHEPATPLSATHSAAPSSQDT